MTTPRTDALFAERLHQDASDWNADDVLAFLRHGRKLELENAILCDFINREMRMIGSDPRIAELEKRIGCARISEGLG